MSNDKKIKIPSVDDLLNVGVHFGHQARRWHPKMSEYIFDKKSNTHIFDLYKTEEGLSAACEFLYKLASEGQQIIFVGTKKQAKDIIENEAARSGALFMSSRWIGGALTNFNTVKKSIDKLKTLMRKRDNNELSHYTKKERLLIDREIAKLQESVGGILNLTGRPAAMFVVDVRREKTAVREARKLGIPVVALVDTNSDPSGVDFVIPGNDDAIRAIALVVKVVADAIEAGYKVHAETIADAQAKAAAESKAELKDVKVVKKVEADETKEKSVEDEKKTVEPKAEKKAKKEVEAKADKSDKSEKKEVKKKTKKEA